MSPLLATTVITYTALADRNADTLSVEDAMEVTAAAEAVAFVEVEYYFMTLFGKLKKLMQQ